MIVKSLTQKELWAVDEWISGPTDQFLYLISTQVKLIRNMNT